MVEETRISRRSITISVFLAIVVLGGVAAALAPAEATGPSSPAALLYEPDDYGIVYLYPYAPSEWDPGDVDQMQAALQMAKDMGVTTIIQPFGSALLGTGNESRWLLFLDEAQIIGIDVVAYLWPKDESDPDYPYNREDLKDFLDVVGDHPALLGYVALHEPLEQAAGISDDDLRDFYTEMKAYEPNAMLGHYMADIAYAEEHRTDGWTFSDGMCDICIIWYYPFRYVAGNPVFEEDLVPPVVESNIDLVNARDPDAEVWFLGQAFTQSSHPRDLRMPTPEEMRQLYWMVMQEPVDGFLWYTWNHNAGIYDEVLSDPDMEDQQAVVGNVVLRVYLPALLKRR